MHSKAVRIPETLPQSKARISEIRPMYSKAIRIPEILPMHSKAVMIPEIRPMHSKGFRVPEILPQGKARIPRNTPYA